MKNFLHNKILNKIFKIGTTIKVLLMIIMSLFIPCTILELGIMVILNVQFSPIRYLILALAINFSILMFLAWKDPSSHSL